MVNLVNCLSLQLHYSWRCSFKFQLCNHNPPGTQRLSQTLPGGSWEKHHQSTSWHLLWIELHRYLIVCEPLSFDWRKSPWQMVLLFTFLHQSKNFTSCDLRPSLQIMAPIQRETPRNTDEIQNCSWSVNYLQNVDLFKELFWAAAHHKSYSEFINWC